MADFRTIHTLTGLAAMASAEATGTTVNLTHMAVGDGNGNAVTPSETQTVLVRELFRSTVNRVFQDPTTPNKFTAELIIPATTGGFVLREIGVFDSNGSLFAVGNLPDTYKPVSSEGAYADTVVRLEFMVSNASVVTLMIDPNVAVATQSWIANNFSAAQLIPGGLTGQVLSKETNADGDYLWADPSVANVVVDVIEERQTLAALQTTVILGTVSTRGLAVYIEGVRIPNGLAAGEWKDDPAEPDTQIILGSSYPAGTEILCVQNEPSGSVPFPLIRDQNLADVPDKAVGRTNLDVYSKAEVNARIRQPGDVFYTAASAAPAFSLKANGAAVSRTAYAALFAAIGTVYGAGDGFTTFNLPDLRGEFIRGFDDGRGVDGGRTMGSAQSGAIQSHGHTGSSAESGNHTHTGAANSAGTHNHSATAGNAGSHSHTTDLTLTAGWGSGYSWPGGGQSATSGTGSAGDHTHSISVGNGGEHAHTLAINAGGTHSHAITVNATGSAETRPRNVALLACIAF